MIRTCSNRRGSLRDDPVPGLDIYNCKLGEKLTRDWQQVIRQVMASGSPQEKSRPLESRHFGILEGKVSEIIQRSG